MELIDRIKRAAEHAGVAPEQTAIAKSLGLSRQTIHQWFHGTRPDSDKFALMAVTWGVSVDWLATEKGEMVPRPATTGLSAEERDIIRFYRNAQPQRRRALYDMAKALGKVAVVAALTIPPLLLPNTAEASFNININRLHIAIRRLQDFLTAKFNIALKIALAT